MYKPLILNDNLKPNILDSILDPLQKSAKFSMDLDSIAAAMVTILEGGLHVLINGLIVMEEDDYCGVDRAVLRCSLSLL